MKSVRIVLISTFAWHFSSAASFSRFSSSTSNPSVCPSRTVNYITHGLPQQCLATSRSIATNATASTPSLDLNATSHDTQNTSTNAEKTSSLGTGQANSAAESSGPVLVTLDSNTEVKKAVSASIRDTSSSTTAPLSSATAVDNSGADSLLDNANFLSFEDWKRQNLAKAGQSEHVGAGRPNQRRDPEKRANPSLQQGLDALGDDAEIDLDFTGFVADRPDLAPPQQPARAIAENFEGGLEQEPSIPSRPRSKDAGTTCKERYNYASFDCAATVLKTNAKAKGEKFVLLENKDSYMLNECSIENKFLILELCEDISIDTIVLANFEFFSSIFRTFRVSVSDKYPVKTDKWITLGTFEARNSREIQAFLIDNPMIWARYVRVEFLTHYGNEFYCPLSLVRVHGTTMMEDFKHDTELRLLGDGEDDPETETASNLDPEETLVPEAVAQVLVDEKSRSEEAERALSTAELSQTLISRDRNESIPEPALELDVDYLSNNTSPNVSRERLFMPSSEVCSTLCTTEISPTATVNETTGPISTRVTMSRSGPSSSTGISVSSSKPAAEVEIKISTSTNNPSIPPIATLNSTSSLSPKTTTTSTKANNSTSSEKPRSSTSPTQPPSASPTIQESFFKSVQKRLQMLESNSSLSLQYIEEQSRALRDAFGRVEQKQMSKTTNFLDYLNATVLNELRDFRQQYDQLWQSTVIELEMQRERYQQETIAINSRLAILADELIFQKRISILQMVLVLICFGLVLFSRGPIHNYMDIPIVQSMLARSPNSKWMSVSGLQTPNTSPPQTRPNSAHRSKPVHGVLKRYNREPSDDSINHVIQPEGEYSPLTPVSNDAPSDTEGPIELIDPESPLFDPSEIERPSTSPPVLPSNEGNATPEFVALRDETIDSRLLLHASNMEMEDGYASTMTEPPELTLRPATPPPPPTTKHLTFQLPEQ